MNKINLLFDFIISIKYSKTKEFYADRKSIMVIKPAERCWQTKLIVRATQQQAKSRKTRSLSKRTIPLRNMRN